MTQHPKLMTQHRWLRYPLIVLAALAMLAAACGTADDAAPSTATTAPPTTAPPTTAPPTTAPPTTAPPTTAPPTTAPPTTAPPTTAPPTTAPPTTHHQQQHHQQQHHQQQHHQQQHHQQQHHQQQHHQQQHHQQQHHQQQHHQQRPAATATSGWCSARARCAPIRDRRRSCQSTATARAAGPRFRSCPSAVRWTSQSAARGSRLTRRATAPGSSTPPVSCQFAGALRIRDSQTAPG